MANEKETTTAPTLTAEQKKAFFDAFEKAKGKVLTAQGALDKTVKDIADNLGTGPFRWQGEEISVVKRGERMTMRIKGQAVEDIG